MVERGVKNQVCAKQSGKDCSELNGEVGGRPECVAPDADMPGNVPVESGGGRCYGQSRRPHIPGNCPRADRRQFSRGLSRRECDSFAFCPETPLNKQISLSSEGGSPGWFPDCHACSADRRPHA